MIYLFSGHDLRKGNVPGKHGDKITYSVLLKQFNNSDK